MKLIKRFKVELIVTSAIIGGILMIFGNATLGAILLLPSILISVFND